MEKKLIIDTDPGIDDAAALAIALFSDDINIELITTVSGNVNLEKVTINTLKLLKFFNKEVPVAKGASTPLIAEPSYADEIHGESGMDGYDFPEPNMDLLVEKHAVEAMREVIMMSKEKITIMAIGPLTNVALLLRMYPEVKDNIEEIALMGGSASRGNKGVYSEFNIAVDPEAAHIVFNSGVKLAIAGMDVGLKALVYPEDSARLKEMNRTGNMLYHLFKAYRGGSFAEGLTMYDSCAVAYLVCSEMFTLEETFVGVELFGEYTRGATAVDYGNLLQKESNVTVCADIDPVMFKDWFMDSLERCN